MPATSNTHPRRPPKHVMAERTLLDAIKHGVYQGMHDPTERCHHRHHIRLLRIDATELVTRLQDGV